MTATTPSTAVTGPAVEAGAGDDSLEGGAGEDTLGRTRSRTEDDVLSGGAGADAIAGGTGDDTFAGTAAELDGDSLTDYEDGETISITDAVLGEDDVTISSANGVTTIALDTDGDGQADSTLEVDGEYAYLTVEPDGQGGTNLSVSATPTDLTLMGTPQEDTLVGGDGNDTISAILETATIWCPAVPATTEARVRIDAIRMAVTAADTVDGRR